MGLDIRWPIGLMFTLLGVLLTAYGITNSTRSVVAIGGQDANINLIWGVVLLVFGVLMLGGAVCGGKTPPKA